MPSGVPNNAALSIVSTYRAEEGHTAQGQGGWYFQVTVVQLGRVLGYVREKLQHPQPLTPVVRREFGGMA
jgi:hypothetical protein